MQRETVGFATGGDGSNQHKKATGGAVPPVAERPPTLTEAGIDKDLAKRARKLHGLPEGGVDGSCPCGAPQSSGASLGFGGATCSRMKKRWRRSARVGIFAGWRFTISITSPVRGSMRLHGPAFDSDMNVLAVVRGGVG
jgi:hypothetical protein